MSNELTFFHSLLLIDKHILVIHQILNNNTRGAFAIHFLICSDLPNCLRSLGTIVRTTESGQNSLKVIFTKQFLTKVTIVRCFDVCSAQPPQIFQVKAKISVRSDLSVSYDYDLAKRKSLMKVFYNIPL